MKIKPSLVKAVEPELEEEKKVSKKLKDLD